MTATFALICALLAGCTVATQPVVAMRPAATVGSAPEGASSVQFRRLATDAVSEPAPLTLAGGTTYTGNLAWADPSHGSRYLALREPVGTLVTACGPAGCVTRRSTDFGPVLSLWRAGRIADLSAADWQTVCGVPLKFGLCPGSIEILSRRPATPLPNTDTEEGP